MRLKLHVLKVYTGRPVIFLHESSAKKIGIRTGDRVTIKKNGNSLVAIVDLVRDIIKKNEAALSEELNLALKGHNKGYIEILPSEIAESSSILHNQFECNQYSQ